MCSTKRFDKVIHWTLILVGIVKLVLDVPCWYFIYTEQYTRFLGHKESFKEKIAGKIFLGMHLAMLKFILDVFLDIVLLYACYKKNKGLLILYSTYNAAVGALTIAGLWRVWRNFSKKVAIAAVNPFSSGVDSNVIAEMYLMFVLIAPYMCSRIDTLQNSALVIFITQFVLVHVVLPFLVVREIKMVTRYRLENRAIVMYLLEKNKEETVPMTTQNSNV